MRKEWRRFCIVRRMRYLSGRLKPAGFSAICGSASGAPSSNLKVAVLFCMTKADLQDVFSLCDLILDLKIILILPDDDEETMAKAHHLRPRYLSWLDDNFLDIGAVLKKMIRLYDVSPVGEDG